MTIYTTDFSEYTDGVQPSDWTDFWSTGGFTALVQANSGTYKVGSKEVAIDCTSPGRNILTWDDIGSVADSDIIAKFNITTATTSAGARIQTRISGTTGSENSYNILLRDGTLLLFKYTNGTSVTLTSIPIDLANNTNYWVRFQTVGTNIRAKVWAEDAIEPTEWKITDTDTDHASGAVGIGTTTTATDFECDYFSCGTGTDEPVFPPTILQDNLLTKYGVVGDIELSAALSNLTRVMGGPGVADKFLTGIKLNHGGHTSDLRIAVYAGGSLSLGPQGGTLLYDFGLVASSTSPLILTTPSPITIPDNEPLWFVLKSDGTGFTSDYSDQGGNSGNYQIARGRCDITAIIGSDASVAFPTTMTAGTGTFADFWYDWEITSEVEAAIGEPVILPISGEYRTTTEISISTTTVGATIYYTIDGSDPDATDIEYTAPFTLSTAKTIKAIGIKAGIDDSTIASETYTIGTIIATPIITPGSGEYNASQLISMSSTTIPSPTIYYTEDGSTPDATDIEYTEPFYLFSDKTIKAIGIRDGLDDSLIATEVYTVGTNDTQISTDFSEYPPAVPLADWTDFWGTGNFTYIPGANSGSHKVGTQQCVFDMTGVDGRAALTWDVVGDVSDVDITILVTKNTSSATGPFIYARVSGTSGSENAYFILIRDLHIGIYKFVDGVFSLIGEVGYFTLDNIASYFKLQVIGTSIKVKHWAVNAIEPVGYIIEATDSSLTSGHVGFGGFDASVVENLDVDYFSVGLLGNKPVFPPTILADLNIFNKFGTVGNMSRTGQLPDITYAQGGMAPSEGKLQQIIGATIIHNGFSAGSSVRVAIYTGGDLATGLNNATLIYDFGKVESFTSDFDPIVFTLPTPIVLPPGVPIWIVLKSPLGNVMTFDWQSPYQATCGNYQLERGQASIGATIGTDVDIAFPITYPDTDAPSFGSEFFNWEVNIEEAPEGTVVTPVIDPTSGAYLGGQLITITTITDGATIYYTEDGSDPDATDTLYTAPFALTSAKTIKAIGIKSGFIDSDIVTEVYTIRTLEVGEGVSCSDGTWLLNPDTYSYQWTRDDLDIPLATSSTYTIVLADIGTSIGCTVTATNTFGSAEADALPIS